jgi:hypothetical protein
MFRQQKNAFKKDNIVTKGPPKHLSGAQIIHMMEKLMPNPERPGYFEGYGDTHNWTHKCGLWELSYMPALIVMHNIDVMHRWITSKYFTLLCIFLSTLLLIIYPLQAASDKPATQFINNMFNSLEGAQTITILMCKRRCHLWILNIVILYMDLDMWTLMLCMDELCGCECVVYG